MYKVAVYCEIDINGNFLNNSYELISKAHELKLQAMKLKNESEFEIHVIAIGEDLKQESIDKMYSAGCDKIIFIKDANYRGFISTIYTKAFVDFYNTVDGYDVILFPATQTTRMLAPRITTELNTGLVADCTELEFIIKNDELTLASTRPTFGSELMATIVSKTKPQCSTVRPNTFLAKFENDKKGEYIEFNGTSYSESRLKIFQSIVDKTNSNSLLTSAKIIFCAGYGLVGNNNEYFNKLETICKKLNIQLASTRKVVDFGIMDRTTQIGQTGKTVSPELYVTFGVSGAIQHISGMKNSKTVVAINNNKDAEIFKYSDYKIIADAKQIIDDILIKIN